MQPLTSLEKNMLEIYDTNNWFRVKSETCFSIRPMIEEARMNDGIIRIFVFDGKNSNDYRRQFYSEYKKNRKLPQDSFFDNLRFFEELLHYAPKTVSIVKLDGVEADDVIAKLCQLYYPYDDINIWSTDRDLTQIKNAKFPMIHNLNENERDYVFTKKVLLGDSSDNYNFCKGFGKSTWDRLTTFTKSKLKELCENPSENLKQQVLKVCELDLGKRAVTALSKIDITTFNIAKKVVGFRGNLPPILCDVGIGRDDIIDNKLQELMI